MSSDLNEFYLKLSVILKKDGRYREDAYLFVMTALGRSMDSLKTPRHITGRELLEGVKREAVEQFGPMAESVFRYWGIENTLDFGHIVFNMVREGILSKSESDTLEDFEDDRFFDRLFDSTEAYRLKEAPAAPNKISMTKKKGVMKG